MIKIDDLNSAGEMFVGNVPYPFCSIAHDNFFGRAAPAAFGGFQIDPFAKFFSSFNRADVGGRVRISDGVTFLIPCGLREYASQLGLPRVRRLTPSLAGGACSFRVSPGD